MPNKLTVIRVCMIPVFLLFFMWRTLPGNYLWALLVFGLASITDTLDGMIARKYGLVTDFGKLMDPLADKLLVMSALLCIMSVNFAPLLAVVVILGREFIVTSIRLVAAGKGEVIAADKWGKIKTVLQMVWICYDLLIMGLTMYLFEIPAFFMVVRVMMVVHYVLMAAVVAMTVFSGFNYVWNNRQLFDDK